MFIHHFDCSWLRHPFLRNRLKIEDEKTIRKINDHGIRDVFIDTDLGTDADDLQSGGGTVQEACPGLPEDAGTGTASRGPALFREEIISSGLKLKDPQLRVRNTMEDTVTVSRLEPGETVVSAGQEDDIEKEGRQRVYGSAGDIRTVSLSGSGKEDVHGREETAVKGSIEKDGKQRSQGWQGSIRDISRPEMENKAVPVQEEIIRAKEIKREARTIVHDLMEDVRLGKQLEMKKVDIVVTKMVDSVLRNKDALSALGRIRKVDEYTFMHSVSVGVLMITFGRYLGFDYELLRSVGIGGMLHDMGKVMVPGELLLKKGRLSDHEMLLVKKHVEHSHSILHQAPGINDISVSVAAHHHERLDGTGYPNKLKGEDISIFGQMSAIVDVYDALTSDRCYQRGILPTLALKKLYEWNMFFNKDLLQQFVRCMGIYPAGTLVRLHSGLLGVVLGHNEDNLLHPVVRIIYDIKKSAYTMPYDIDLLEDHKTGGRNRVVNCELPDKWKIRPEMYL